MSDEEFTPDQARALRLKQLWTLRSRDSDVKDLINTVLGAEDTDIFALADEKPDVFDELYESCMMMVEELGEQVKE